MFSLFNFSSIFPGGQLTLCADAHDFNGIYRLCGVATTGMARTPLGALWPLTVGVCHTYDTTHCLLPNCT